MFEIYRRYNPNQHTAPPSNTQHQRTASAPNLQHHPTAPPPKIHHQNTHGDATSSRTHQPDSHHAAEHTYEQHSPKPQKPIQDALHHSSEKQASKKAQHTHRDSKTDAKPHPPKGFSAQFLYNLIPKSLYNPETKKILGLLDPEDLLIIALIFLFLEDTEEDNPLMILALFYILFSDSFDLGDFLF